MTFASYEYIIQIRKELEEIKEDLAWALDEIGQYDTEETLEKKNRLKNKYFPTDEKIKKIEK